MRRGVEEDEGRWWLLVAAVCDQASCQVLLLLQLLVCARGLGARAFVCSLC